MGRAKRQREPVPPQPEVPITPPVVVAALVEPSAPPVVQETRWRVESGGVSLVVVAENERDAWAVFCDTVKQWPGGKATRTIERV